MQTDTKTDVKTKNGKISVIIGLGTTGLSCARYYAARNLPFKVVDSRVAPPGLACLKKSFPRVEIELGAFNPATLFNASELVISPGVSLDVPEIRDAIATGVPVTGDIDIFSKQVSAPIIAVTGSNGKSTVVALLAEIFSRANINFGLGGNLDGDRAKPALDLLLESESDPGEAREKTLYLLELSSFQLETTMALGAEVAVLLNLSEDHMDRYPDMAAYHRTKQKVFIGARQIVVNRDDSYSKPLDAHDALVWDYGVNSPSTHGFGLLEVDGDQYLSFRFQELISIQELKVFGQHNVSNVLAAITIATAAGIDREAILDAVRNFAGLPHRCQWVRTLRGVEYYNDSKGTNVGATVAAIEGLGQKLSGHIILIAGGIGKGADFAPLAPAVNRWAREVILIGRDAVELAATFDSDTRIFFADGLPEAVVLAASHATAGDAILLSPACASFDMFGNFQQRGEVFINAVESLA
ncbi:MAG: UDP-N-acetylmuramoyl-L-alanine--D-glutamate ligase [Pseudohongiellaceae bacterium]